MCQYYLRRYPAKKSRLPFFHVLRSGTVKNVLEHVSLCAGNVMRYTKTMLM
jgi:hypothetical protein